MKDAMLVKSERWARQSKAARSARVHLVDKLSTVSRAEGEQAVAGWLAMAYLAGMRAAAKNGGTHDH
jgi:hypothetical protein